MVAIIMSSFALLLITPCGGLRMEERQQWNLTHDALQSEVSVQQFDALVAQYDEKYGKAMQVPDDDPMGLREQWNTGFLAACGTLVGPAPNPMVEGAPKWILEFGHNRGICFEASSLAGLCGCDGVYPIQPAEPLKPSEFAIYNDGRECAAIGFTETDITFPLYTGPRVNLKCGAATFETSLRKHWMEMRGEWQQFLDGSRSKTKSAAAAFSPKYYAGTVALLGQPTPVRELPGILGGLFEGSYCGGALPCGADGVNSEWIDSAFCYVNPDTGFVLDTVTPRTADGQPAKTLDGKTIVATAFYMLKKDPTDGRWRTTSLEPQLRADADDARTESLYRCRAVLSPKAEKGTGI